jgi:hypothetical protein
MDDCANVWQDRSGAVWNSTTITPLYAGLEQPVTEVDDA